MASLERHFSPYQSPVARNFARSFHEEQIEYGGFRRARPAESENMIRERVRILYLLFFG